MANNERQNAAILEHLQAPYIHTGKPRLKLLELPKAQMPRTEIKEMLLLSTALLNSITLGHRKKKKNDKQKEVLFPRRTEALA